MSSREINLLLVEANLDEAEHIQQTLESVNSDSYNIIHANSLFRSYEYLKGFGVHAPGIDAILLDMNLPDSRGYEAFERIHGITTSIPIILLINSVDEGVARKAVQGGAQDYLIKTDISGSLLSRVILYAIDRKQTEEALLESQEKFRLAIRGANDGLWDWKITKNCMHFSPRWKEILGFNDEEIGHDPAEWLDRIHPGDVDRIKTSLLSHINNDNGHFEAEHRIRCKDGSYIWVLTRGLANKDRDGCAYRMGGSLADINSRKRTEDQLFFDTFHDPLTRLPNRALFLDRLNCALEKTQQESDYQFAVIFLDLDRFKLVNDSLGHKFGDKLLNSISDYLVSSLRPGDTLARLGGDEFVILLDKIVGVTGALEIVNLIQRGLQKPFEIDGQNIVTTASMGIVFNDTIYKAPESIIRDAGIAMYQAKMLGKDSHVIFTPSMRMRAINRMELENDLRKAVFNLSQGTNELDIVFQPIVSLTSGMIEGFEALLRWYHPERGEILPNEFIPIAEETDLIHPLGIWVLRQACSQLKTWEDEIQSNGASPLSISVNLSLKQLSRPDFMSDLEDIIRDYQTKPSTLSLEITESLLVGPDDYIQSVLDKIRDIGVKIFIDDFGRGYSSFSYLQQFPVNTLKIDSLFTRWLGSNGKNAEIVRSIMKMADSLGISVVAEGVETKVQLQQLINLKCPSVQGFLFSEPLPSVAAGELLVCNRQLYNPVIPRSQGIG